MCERTGLKFIALFTPLRHSLHSPTTGTCITPVSTPYYKVQSDESISESENDYTALEGSILYHNPSSHQKSSDNTLHQPFTHDEIFTRRKVEGYDIKTDSRYNYWLSLQDEATGSAPSSPEPVLQLSSQSVVSKLIAAIPPDRVIPKFTKKSTARILTSEECRKEINEKERKKVEALRQKEERKVERQRKQEEKRKILEEKQKRKQISEDIIIHFLALGYTTMNQQAQRTETSNNY